MFLEKYVLSNNPKYILYNISENLKKHTNLPITTIQNLDLKPLQYSQIIIAIVLQHHVIPLKVGVSIWNNDC